jgi:hypothetical protein
MEHTKGEQMLKSAIERDVPGIGVFTRNQLKEISQAWCNRLDSIVASLLYVDAASSPFQYF